MKPFIQRKSKQSALTKYETKDKKTQTNMLKRREKKFCSGFLLINSPALTARENGTFILQVHEHFFALGYVDTNEKPKDKIQRQASQDEERRG